MVEILFTFVAGVPPARSPSYRSSPTIQFYLKTMRGKPHKITLECDVLLNTFARFKPSLSPDLNRLS